MLPGAEIAKNAESIERAENAGKDQKRHPLPLCALTASPAEIRNYAKI